MAVPAYLRNESKAQFVTTAVRLAAWALKWCKDERLFTRRERWIITGDIWQQAKRVLLHVKQANARKDLKAPDDYKARRKHLKKALDALEALKILLTIKYEMVLHGFNAPKTASPEEPAAAPDTAQKKKRRTGKRLTQDDIDRIFEIFFDMCIREEELIKGVLRSDAERHHGADSAQ
ncbi:MAG: hypothetical protein ACI4OL_08650 [Gemmiger sp.]